MKLFMVCLGGNTPKSNIELHDIQFVVGETIEDTYKSLRANWFGDQKGLHIDSYKIISVADSYKVELKDHPQENDNKLYFVNLGGYIKEQFMEQHAIGLFVGSNKDDVKKRAKQKLLTDVYKQHTDDLFQVDDCIALTEVGGYHIHLTPTEEPANMHPDWFGYNVIGEK